MLAIQIPIRCHRSWFTLCNVFLIRCKHGHNRNQHGPIQVHLNDVRNGTREFITELPSTHVHGGLSFRGMDFAPINIKHIYNLNVLIKTITIYVTEKLLKTTGKRIVVNVLGI